MTRTKRLNPRDRGVFLYIHSRSRCENSAFIIGMEGGNPKPGRPGELAAIKACPDVDAF